MSSNFKYLGEVINPALYPLVKPTNEAHITNFWYGICQCSVYSHFISGFYATAVFCLEIMVYFSLFSVVSSPMCILVLKNNQLLHWDMIHQMLFAINYNETIRIAEHIQGGPKILDKFKITIKKIN